ncbi:kinase-like protein, partial [Rhizophagus irregularis]
NRPSKSIYGNLPYIAPEVINGKEYTFKSDIYSFAMLMWEISSGQPPFINYEHDYDLAMKIINGIRPKIVPGTPLEYKNLIEQCWNADPSKRLDIYTLWNEIRNINISYINNQSKLAPNNNLKINKSNSLKSKDINSALYTSKLHQFENLPEPRNATEEELEALHSKSHDLEIPDNIEAFNKSSSRTFKRSSKIFNIKKLQSMMSKLTKK